MSPASFPRRTEADRFADSVEAAVRDGGRFAGLVAPACDDGSTVLRALLATPALVVIETIVGSGVNTYPALTPLVPSAAWYEREIHDLFGIEPVGHRRLDPLVLPLGLHSARPRPGGSSPAAAATLELDFAALPGHVSGEGLFTIPYGPVRSGVFESVEYLVETSGEEIPHLRTRVYHKHRGLEQRFVDLDPSDAVLLAERVEGAASVAHAMAFSQAIETLAGVEAPRCAQMVRVVHAELERVAAHLDSIIRHTEGAGQAVAYARMSLHKERIMRLRALLCGHRFGRGVVVPGGVTGPLQLDLDDTLAEVGQIDRAIASDAKALMATPSFLDRLRGTGPLPAELALANGALGPVGRGSGLVGDIRLQRPYGAYRFLGFEAAEGFVKGDALARQWVRIEEIRQAFHLVRQGLDELSEGDAGPWQYDVTMTDGLALGWVEAPQGELLYLVEAEGGRLVRVKPRCASFHNLALFAEAFRGDIFTDFVFIEASFGLSIAGVSG
jgi:Ni,Fe-hydrogenase III large subunit